MEIIVILYKNPEVEERCLESVRKFTDLNKHKLTVFDNAPENINLGKLWNQLIEESDEEVICLLNSDCVVEEGWTRIEETFEQIENVGAIGPVTDNCGTIQKGMPKGYEMKLANDISGFCYVFRKSVWKEVGGFPEDMPFYGQESIFNRKLQDHGYDLWIDRRVFVHHDKGASYKKEGIVGEDYWGAFHYWNYLSRLDILRSLVKKDFKIIIIGGGRDNPFPLHKGFEQAADEFFGSNALVLNQESIFQEVLDIFPADLILCTDTKFSENTEKFLKKAKKIGIKTALYYTDYRCPVTQAMITPDNLIRDLTDTFDAVFFCSKAHIECWEHITKVPVYYMPQGSIQHPRPPVGEKYHIVHVGSEDNGYYHQGRTAIIRQIRDTYPVVTLDSKIREERAEIEELSYGKYHESDYSVSISFPGEGYSSIRLYNIVCSGGVALLQQPGGLDDIFRDREHVLFFRSAEEAKKIIQRGDTLDKQKVFEYAQKHHTVKMRLLNILQILYTDDKSFHGDRNNLWKIGK